MLVRVEAGIEEMQRDPKPLISIRCEDCWSQKSTDIASLHR